MKHARVQVPWKEGLHLRPATRLVRLAKSFRSTILLRCGGKLADARSLVSILLLTATLDAVVEVEATGDDEVTAAAAMAQAFSADDDGGNPDVQRPG